MAIKATPILQPSTHTVSIHKGWGHRICITGRAVQG
jgi:hypothetical protein